MSIHIDSSNPLSLYIHIPFCFHKCDYCAFYSVSHTSEETIEKYVQILLSELKELVASRTMPFTTVLIGGGNPGLIKANRLLSIVSIITSLGKVEEFTIEMNPESLTQEMDILFAHGVNRLSIGIQTLKEEHLNTLQRSASKQATIRALNMSRRIHTTYGTSINVDIMTCIPGQTIEESKEDIHSILDLAHVDHISLYNLTYEEGTLLTKKRDNQLILSYDEDKEREFLETLWDYLESIGFHQYEISNFARDESHQCKHNIRYWNLEDYIGIGPSSVGTFHVGNHFIRQTGTPSIQSYIDNRNRYVLEELKKVDEIVEYIMVRLRMIDGIDKHIFKKRFNISFYELFCDEILLLQKNMEEHIHNNDDNFSLTKSGLLMCDSIVSLLSNKVWETESLLDCKN
jgi:oxygen-independent coproporphyrinogen-3 oxidase